MYLIDKNNNITITRGDYLEFPVKLVTGEFPRQSIWELEDNDVALFGLMLPHQPFEEALLKKTFTKDDEDKDGNLYIKILPEDTLFLKPGLYYYQVKTIYKTGNEEETHVDTVVQKTRFIIVD